MSFAAIGVGAAALGGVASGIIGSKASSDAAKTQTDALAKQRNFVFKNLDPSIIGPQATQADFANAINRLVEQGKLDPALLETRYSSEGSIKDQLAKIGQDSGTISRQAISEAINPTLGKSLNAAGEADLAAPTAGKDQLIAAAMDELKQGATLPPDVQAELVKAGLENSGMVTQTAGGQGTGGQILRTILGTAGLQLKQQREQQAAANLTAAQALDTQRKQTATGLLTAGQNLEQSRAAILQNLFPSLASTQLANLGGAASTFGVANSALPNAGLSGTDVANLWLARVGATNQLAQSSANITAQNQINQGQILNTTLGGLTRAAGSTQLPAAFKTVSGWFGNTQPASANTD